MELVAGRRSELQKLARVRVQAIQPLPDHITNATGNHAGVDRDSAPSSA